MSLLACLSCCTRRFVRLHSRGGGQPHISIRNTSQASCFELGVSCENYGGVPTHTPCAVFVPDARSPTEARLLFETHRVPHPGLSTIMLIHTAGPHTALIKSSGSGQNANKIVIGGRMFVIPILERVDSLDLRLRTLTIRTSKGMSTNGVNVDVVSCCQVKVQGWSPGQDGEMIIDMAAVRLAAQHFIGKKREQMNDAIQKTIAGHQRGIIATLTVEELYRDRAAFSSRVVEVCEQDMRNMGLAIVSYTVAEISDENDYVKALGVSQTEKVKREATEGAARHINFALSLESELQTEADVKINKQRGRKVESDKMLLVRKADADRVVEQALAIQRKAGQIKSVQHDGYLQVQKQDTRTKKNIAKRSTLALRVEKERMETTVNVTVHADAELYKKRVEADISRVFALANADRIKVEGEAEAEADRAKGKAEMDVLKERVNVWMDSANPGAVMEKLIDTLPAIAAEIAAPLGNTERLVFIGGRGEERIPAQFETNRARSWRGGT